MKFLYMAQGGRLNKFIEIPNDDPEFVYSCVCCWYMPSTKVIVINEETKIAAIFTRTLDENGNLISINREL